MTPKDRQRAREAWQEMARHHPDMAETLSPFVKEFGLEAFTYLRFETPVPRPPSQLKVPRTMSTPQAWVVAFPDEARRILGLIDSERVMEEEGRAWTR